MKKIIVASSEADTAKAFISKNLKIADKSLENAIRHIIFDPDNIIDWDKAVKVFKENMPELSSTAIELDFDKCMYAASNILNGSMNNRQRDRAEEVDLDIYVDAETLAQEINVLLYIKYGLEDGEDYQLMNNSIMMVNPRDAIWTAVRIDLGE